MYGDESTSEELRACREASRRRLRGIRASAPLADVLREHALVHVPPAAAARLRLVHPTWKLQLSSPLFAVAHAGVPRRMSGFFIPEDGFLPFDGSDTMPSKSLSFAPASSEVTVLSSSHGVACCFSPADDVYFVCNPATASWASIPSPPYRTWPRSAIIVLFLDASAYNFRGDYTLVYASECAPGSGTYCFQVFTSATGAWRITDAIAPAEGLVAASGVAAGATAWWRTSIGTAVGYSPETGRVEQVLCPGDSGMWEIGSAGDKLHCAVLAGRDVVVFRLVEHGSWEEAARVSVEEMFPPPLPWQPKPARDEEAETATEAEAEAAADEARNEEAQTVEEAKAEATAAADEASGKEGAAWPVAVVEDEVVVLDENRVQLLGFQGAELEVVALAGRRLVAFDTGTRRRREITVPYQPEGERWEGAEYVAHTNTLALVPPAAMLVHPPVDPDEVAVASP